MKRRAQALRLVRPLIIASLMVSTTTIFAATYPPGFQQTFVAGGLASPTAMAFAPDGRLFVCLQTGQIRVIKNGALLPDAFLSITVDPSGERGLLGIAFDPNFSAIRPYVYVYYTVPGSPAHNRVSRFSANGDLVLPGSEVQRSILARTANSMLPSGTMPMARILRRWQTGSEKFCASMTTERFLMTILSSALREPIRQSGLSAS